MFKNFAQKMIKTAGGMVGLKYDAATPTRSRRPFVTSTLSEDKELRPHDRQAIISQGRDLLRNFALAGFMVRKHLQYVASFSFEATCKAERGASEERKREIDDFNELLEEKIKTWQKRKNCDLAQRHCFSELLELIETHRVFDGDAGVLKVNGGRIQVIEGDRIGTALVLAGGAMAGIATVVGTVIGIITTVIGTVAALATSLAAIPIAVVAIGAAVAYYFGLFDSAIGSLMETWSAAWGGIVAAVMKGDLQTAIDIVWNAIQITWTQGVNFIKSLWRGTIDTIKMIWRGVGDFIGDAWSLVVGIVRKGIATLAAEFKLLGRLVKIAWDIIKNPTKITTAFSDIRQATREVSNDLLKTFKKIDTERNQAISGRAAASQAAYDADQKASQAAYDADMAKLATLQEKQKELIAKANEPVVTSPSPTTRRSWPTCSCSGTPGRSSAVTSPWSESRCPGSPWRVMALDTISGFS